MSKVLRLHTSGVDTLEDWQNCAVYGSDVISQIEDQTAQPPNMK